MTWEQFRISVPPRVLARIVDFEARGIITHKNAIHLLDLCLELGKPNACSQT